ncbi:zinc-ribbon domain containing protein [Patescibacteria group bacterium]
MADEFSDITIRCNQCEENFIWTAKEQAFFKERGLENKPSRCIDCRKQRRKQLKDEKKLMDIRCVDCGVQSTSRFFETNNKPIYCPNCFDKLKKSDLEKDGLSKKIDQKPKNETTKT